MAEDVPVVTDPTDRTSSLGNDRKLEGQMGVTELVFTVLAFNGPLASVAGYLALVISYDGVGAPLVLAAAGLITSVFAIGFTAMSRYMPRPGAFYSYITAGVGRIVGLGGAFLAVFAYSLVLLGVYPFFGIVCSQLVSGVYSGPDIGWYWYALSAWIAVTVMSYRNVELSAKALSVALGLELMMVLIFDIAVLINGGPEGRSLQPFNPSIAFTHNVGIALLFSVSQFLGFEATAIFREEVKQPSKTIPRATYAAVLVIVVLYVGSSWILITAFGIDSATDVAQKDPAGMFLTAMGRYVGNAGVDFVSVLLISSVLAALLSVANVLSRYLFALGKDGVLPPFLGGVHPSFASPYKASLVVSAMTIAMGLLVVAVGAKPEFLYGSLAGVGGFAIIILELITSIAVFVFFHKSSQIVNATRWHTAIAPAFATLGLALVVFLAITNFPTLVGGSNLLAVVFQFLTWGVFLVGMGLALIYRKYNLVVYERIGRQDL